MNPDSPGDFVVEETCVDRQRMLAGMLVIQQGLDCVSAGSLRIAFCCLCTFSTSKQSDQIEKSYCSGTLQQQKSIRV